MHLIKTMRNLTAYMCFNHRFEHQGKTVYFYKVKHIHLTCTLQNIFSLGQASAKHKSSVWLYMV